MVVSVSRDGAIAIATINNPPVNAASHAVRSGLLEVLENTESDATVTAVVLICTGKTFIAGADIREFGQPIVPPTLPELLRRIELASKPWVAAIHGTALGGGLETAMVCRYRIATADARLGLPEVNLGLIPGAGGTVRLPRLIPADKALDMITSGKPVSAQTALQRGLIDSIAENDLMATALDLARNVSDQPLTLPVAERPPLRPDDQNAFISQTKKIERKAGKADAPKAAVQSLKNALDMDAMSAFAAERKLFQTLRDGPQSQAMRHIFFAERATTKIERITGVTPRPLSQIGVIGGGTMGAGIAASCLLSGYSVQMIERDAKAAAEGGERVKTILASSLDRGLIDALRHEALVASFATSEQYETLANADLVIEAVFEDMAVKKEVLTRLESVVKPDAVLASNTSYLDVNEIAAATSNPDRVIGLHFFSPAHIMKLLEVVVPDQVTDEVLATGVAFAKSLRKIPVLAGVCDGFIANRIMSAYRRECEYMLEDGALPWQIDKAMTDFGLPIGIFQMQDLAGLDISWAMRKRQAATRAPSFRYVDIADKLCEQGYLGRKTGRGYYLYENGKTGTPDPEVEALILAESERKGINRSPMTDEHIMSRVLATILKEGRNILDEGIAKSADDIDVVMVNAYGFPRWTGGPMFQSDQKLVNTNSKK